MNKIMEEIQKLSQEEQLEIAHAIWEHFEARDYVFEPDAEQKKWLDQRIDAHRKDPKAGLSWEEVQARALAR